MSTFQSPLFSFRHPPQQALKAPEALVFASSSRTAVPFRTIPGPSVNSRRCRSRRLCGALLVTSPREEAGSPLPLEVVLFSDWSLEGVCQYALPFPCALSVASFWFARPRLLKGSQLPRPFHRGLGFGLPQAGGCRIRRRSSRTAARVAQVGRWRQPRSRRLLTLSFR